MPHGWGLIACVKEAGSNCGLDLRARSWPRSRGQEAARSWPRSRARRQQDQGARSWPKSRGKEAARSRGKIMAKILGQDAKNLAAKILPS